jgi:hypothetical protein
LPDYQERKSKLVDGLGKEVAEHNKKAKEYALV